MLWIRDVPNFEYILIHVGNTDENTDGCLLVGEGGNTGGELRVTQSANAYAKLYQQVVHAAEANDLSIEIVDRDTAMNFKEDA